MMSVRADPAGRIHDAGRAQYWPSRSPVASWSAMTTLGARLRRARQHAGLTQDELAGAEISPSFVSLVELDARRPAEPTLALLAHRVGVSAAWLRLGPEDPAHASVPRMRERAQQALAAGDARAALAEFDGVDLVSVPPELRASTTVLWADALECTGDLAGARAVLEGPWQRAVVAEEAQDALTLAAGLLYLHVVEGRYQAAVDVGRTVWDLTARARVDADERLRIGSTVLWALMERGDLAYARLVAERLLAESVQHGGAAGRAAVVWNVAVLESERGEHEPSRRHARATVALLGDPAGGRDRNFYRAHSMLAEVLLRGHSPEARSAMHEIEVAASGLDLLGGPHDLLNLALAQSRAHLHLGESIPAQRSAEDALSRAEGLGGAEVAEAAVAAADSLMSQGRVAAALDLCTRACVALETAEMTWRVAALWRAVGERLHAGGHAAQAAHAFARALSASGVRPGGPRV